MPISVGDRLPDAVFKVMTASGPVERTTNDIFGRGRVALFAVPGAFTPTCHNVQLPSFLKNLDKLKAKGVDAVACTAVNDVFVMDAWAKASGAGEAILFLADGSAAFARQLGLELDATVGGLGVRSQRYAMIVEDGVVKTLNVDPQPGKAEVSTAEALLAAL
jgi:glutaredoxin/glutathione-dependent peroxiredoxin